ncbi:hypothetical protein CKF54_07190 [Psittacicella hinzii]|uniref:BspA family leucine-rich repeat surface protein n=1 Tax=Psittacicella hinzii TaxID=2028575 RepID=A0A3A1XYV7_9GAMM|nr:BspA family leucine-rich repeat surface protein [Psittacicella hinzii]RIY31212.1 hypothetical protein CKF54_07190 [Psittacicella hinzii]
MSKRVIISSILTALALGSGYFVYQSMNELQIVDPVYSPELGDYYAVDLSKQEVKFRFSSSAKLKEFIQSYMSVMGNKLEVVDLNFIDTSKLEDLDYVFAGDYEFVNAENFYNDQAYDLSGNNFALVSYDEVYLCKAPSSYQVDISKWNISKVKSLAYTFSCSTSNFDLSNWDTSNVKSLHGTFAVNANFNNDISRWDVGSVEDMRVTFVGAQSFNADLSKWQVGKVKDMMGLFRGAKEFNMDLSAWDMSKVTDISYMFYGATKFNSNLNPWNLSSVRSAVRVFWGSGMTEANLTEVIKKYYFIFSDY